MKQFFDIDMIVFMGLFVIGSLDWVDPFYKIGLLVFAMVALIYKIIDYHKKWKNEEKNKN